ncbi:MAG TPA: divalent-cation tolerance protein CutA [Burkholderiales bacterium]|nr:divalent-cation tolerance protein CutA [Burkholderiales bacterium]
MTEDAILVLTNFPNRDAALELAHKLVEARLAACVNVMAECTSVYRWKGKIETAQEVPVFIKTLKAHFPRLEQMVRQSHPYELPELVAVPISDGLKAYLDWLAVETHSLTITG